MWTCAQQATLVSAGWNVNACGDSAGAARWDCTKVFNEPLFCPARLRNVQIEARRRARCYIIVVDASLLGYITVAAASLLGSASRGSGQAELAVLDPLDELRPRPVAEGEHGSGTVLG